MDSASFGIKRRDDPVDQLLSSLYKVSKSKGRNIEKRRKVEQMRGPWVPAPAKSSTANFTSISETRKPFQRDSSQFYSVRSSSSSPEMGSRNVVQGQETMPSFTYEPTPQASRTRTGSVAKKTNRFSRHPGTNQSNIPIRNTRKPIPQIKKAKHGNRKMGRQYALKSKDSLVDVTACLQEKREEVMKLWEKSRIKGDPVMILQLETANRLALEAAEEVEKLRRTILDFQSKDEGLSDSDCGLLEQMRVNVLEKVRLFEEADNNLHDFIARQSTSKTSIHSGTSKRSQTEVLTGQDFPVQRSESSTSVPHFSTENPNPLLPSKSHSAHVLIGRPNEMVVLKEISDTFVEESELEVDNSQPKQIQRVPSVFQLQEEQTEGIVSGVSTRESLVRLRALFEEAISLSDLPGNVPTCTGTISVKATTSVENPPETSTNSNRSRIPSRVRFEGESRTEILSETAEDVYREKISVLQRHLMETENEVEELKSEMERIESDSNFRVRILQNHVQDKFETLQVIPEYLELIDTKLKETVEDRGRLQQALEMKDVLIKELKEQNQSLKDENIDLREQIRVAENGKDFLCYKNSDLEKQNETLRKQVDKLTSQVAELTCEVKTCKESEVKFRSRRDHSLENHKLKLECEDLSEQLAQSKKTNLSLRKSKTKVVASLNERIEELLQALQQTQQHKRILGEQIRYLKKSYNQLFPEDMFKCPSSIKATASKKRVDTENSRPSDEPLIQSEQSWRTGSGIRLTDLLNLPITRIE